MIMLQSRKITVDLHLCLTVQYPADAYPCDRQAVPCVYVIDWEFGITGGAVGQSRFHVDHCNAGSGPRSENVQRFVYSKPRIAQQRHKIVRNIA